jgi:POTRA domain, FtsQ-type/Cell division protein FtsQ
MSDPTSPLQQFDGPRVDPRFRRRWAEARRAEGRRRLKVLLSVVALAAIVGGCIGLLHSPVFRVRNVVVVGNARTPRAQVLAAAGLTPGTGEVLMVDAGPPRATRALDALPWVASATFERRWPWTMVIRVKERAPVARVMSGDAEDVVDKSGRVLEVSLPPRSSTSGTSTSTAGVSGTTLPVPALPLIVGAQGAAAGAYVSPGAGLNEPDLHELLAAANDAPHALAARQLKVAYSATDGLTAYIGSAKTVVLLGDASNLALKLAILEELETRVNLASYSQADLTVPERPALTPLPSGVLSVG